MLGIYASIFTVNVPLSYQKKNNLRRKIYYVSINSKNKFYPALLEVNKREIEKRFSENGCIPDELRGIEDYQIEHSFGWNYAKQVTFKCISTKLIDHDVFDSSLVTCEDSTADVKLPNIEELSQFFKSILIDEDLVLKEFTKVRLRYNTQTYLFYVVNIEPSNQKLKEKVGVDYNYGFICYCDTIIEIVEKKVEDNNKTFSYEDFAGYQSEVNSLREYVNNYLESSVSFNGILITGLSGTGKSYLCSILGDIYKNSIVSSSEDLISNYSGETESNLKKLFKKANKRVPSLLVIDNIDEICTVRGEDKSNASVVNAFLHLIDGGQANQQTLVIATASRPDLVDQALRRPGRLSYDINLKNPDEQGRLAILKKMLQSYFKNQNADINSLCEEIAKRTSGFVAVDLKKLITEAFSYTEDNSTLPNLEHFCQALKVVKPKSLKNVVTHTSNVTFDDILGYPLAISELKSPIEVLQKYPNIYERCNLPPMTRILLFGPPGCGKTMMTQALANHFSFNIIVVKRSNVFGKYFGESEKNLENLFEKAKNSSPCILHFENFTGLAGKNENSEVSNDVEERVMTYLKIKFNDESDNNVFVVAETNRPELLNEDVIRRGRFHKYIYVDLPSLEDRKKILDPSLQGVLTDLPLGGWSLETLAEKTKRFSVAEVKLLCKEIKNKLILEDVRDPIEEALVTITAGTSSKRITECEKFASIYCRNFLREKT